MPNLNEMKLFTRKVEFNANKHLDYNHLREGLDLMPDKVVNMIDSLFITKSTAPTPLLEVLRQVGSIKRQTLRRYDFEWSLNLDKFDVNPVIEARTSSATPGINYTEFQIKFSKKMFFAGDVISPGTLDTDQLLYVRDDGYKDGAGYVYTVVMYDANQNTYLDRKYLTPGTEWSKLFNTQGEGSEGGGAYLSNARAFFRNTMTQIHKEYTVTGAMYDNDPTVREIYYVDSEGKSKMSYLLSVEEKYWRQFFVEEYEAALWFSKKTDGKVVDTNGNPIISGAGLLEQIKDSNVVNYNVFTTDFLTEVLTDMLIGRVDIEDRNRSILYIFTGEVGMLQFNKAAEDVVAKNTWKIIGGNAFNSVNKTTSSYHKNAYSLGAQFVELQLYNGITVRVVHNPLFDNPKFSREIDPITGKPIASREYVIFDISYGEADQNIYLVEPREPLSAVYVEGKLGPTGRKRGKATAAHAGDYYKFSAQRISGIQIIDPTRILRITPSVY